MSTSAVQQKSEQLASSVPVVKRQSGRPKKVQPVDGGAATQKKAPAKAPTTAKKAPPKKKPATTAAKKAPPKKKPATKAPVKKAPVEKKKKKVQKKKKEDIPFRFFKMYCPNGEFYGVYEKEKVPVTKDGKPISKDPRTRGRFKGRKLGEAAAHAYGSLVKAFNKKEKVIPQELKYSIVECTKNCQKKDNIYSYVGSRTPLKNIKVVRISGNKKKKQQPLVPGGAPLEPVEEKKEEPLIASFKDLHGKVNFLKYIDEKEYQEGVDATYDIKGPPKLKKRGEKKAPPRDVLERKYLRVVPADKWDPNDKKAENLTVHLYEHSITRVPGIGKRSEIEGPKQKKKKAPKAKVEQPVEAAVTQASATQQVQEQLKAPVRKTIKRKPRGQTTNVQPVAK